MKRSQKILVTAVISAASALAFNGANAASIANTPHNLGSTNNFTKTPSGNAVANHSANTAEICVFCHTPHGGDNGAAVPIWNRKLGINGTGGTAYKRYSALGTTTFDATEAPVGSVSIACLSCHDGTQAIDNVINMPGSGGYNYTTGSTIGSFVGGDTDGSGKLAATVVQNLTTDLSNDHPVSMQYAGGGYSVGTPTLAKGQTKDPDFFPASNVAAPTTSPLQKLWWIDSQYGMVSGVRDREDVILYTRNELGTLQPFVECGSCHDPHNADNQTFLRISNSGSAVPADILGRTFPNANGTASGLCLTCHEK